LLLSYRLRYLVASRIGIGIALPQYSHLCSLGITLLYIGIPSLSVSVSLLSQY
jgi:hypothetical protein